MDNNSLIDKLVEEGRLETDSIIDTFRAVDRKHFLPKNLLGNAYDDTPQPIGFNQTISAPHMVAIMTEALQPKEGDKILEIGAGSGYQAAILAELVKPGGKIITVERLEGLAEFAMQNLKHYENVKVICADGTLGHKKESPYDKIIVTAAAPKIPELLVEQLKENGKMAIPVGTHGYQDFLIIKKTAEGIEKKHVCGCVFVPLIGKEGVNPS